MNTLTLPLCPRIASRLPEAKGQYPPVGCSAMVQSAKLLKASNPLRVDRECPEELESSSVMGQWEQERFLVDGIWGGPKSPHWRGTGSMPFEPLKYPFCSVCCRMFTTEKRWWRGFATRCPPALYSAMWKRVRLRAGTAAAARSSTILLRALPSRQQGKWNRPGRHPQPSAPRGACACRVIPLHPGRPCSLLPQSRRRPEGQARRSASLTFRPEDQRHDQHIREQPPHLCGLPCRLQ